MGFVDDTLKNEQRERHRIITEVLGRIRKGERILQEDCVHAVHAAVGLMSVARQEAESLKARLGNADALQLRSAVQAGILDGAVVKNELKERGKRGPFKVEGGSLLTGAPAHGRLPCLYSGCKAILDLQEHPDGYCNKHKGLGPRTYFEATFSGPRPRNLDAELLEAQKSYDKAARAMAATRADLKAVQKAIAEYDRKYQRPPDPEDTDHRPKVGGVTLDDRRVS